MFSFKAMMQNAIEHSDSTASTELINIPNIEVFLKNISDIQVHVPKKGSQVIKVILEKKIIFIHKIDQRKRIGPDTN